MEPFIGQIMLFGGNFAPRGWAFCHGQLLPISEYTALFSILGTMYGGDGRTTFGLPDLRGRTPVGAGHDSSLSNYAIGAKGGVEQVALSIQNLPAHSHNAVLSVTTDNATSATATAASVIAKPGKVDGREFTPSEGFKETTPNTALQDNSVKVASTGEGQPFNNRPPYLGLNYCIALVGVFPSRS